MKFYSIVEETWNTSTTYRYINKLIFVCKTSVSKLIILLARSGIGQIPETRVAPSIEIGNGRSGSALHIQINGGALQSDKACKQRLVQSTISKVDNGFLNCDAKCVITSGRPDF